MKYQSRETTIENAKTFFKQTSNDVITIEEAWRAWGREITPEKEEGNKSWFSNKLTQMKYHNIVKPIYVIKKTDKGIRRLLSKIELTLEGKRMLGRLENQDSGTPADALSGHAKPADHYDQERSMSIPEVMRAVAKLRKDHPEFEITFDIKLKEVTG